MPDERTDEPSEEEREETVSDLDVPEEEAEDLKGGRGDAVEGFKI